MEDLSERLFAHFVGGRWRVPFGTEQVPVAHPDGARAGTVVLAEARDVARACNILRGADHVARARAGKALSDLGIPAFDAPMPPANAPVLLNLGTTDPQALGVALGAGLGHGLIWCPPPEAALEATKIALHLQNADLPPGCFALIHAFTPRTERLIKEFGFQRRASQK